MLLLILIFPTKVLATDIDELIGKGQNFLSKGDPLENVINVDASTFNIAIKFTIFCYHITTRINGKIVININTSTSNRCRRYVTAINHTIQITIEIHLLNAITSNGEYS